MKRDEKTTSRSQKTENKAQKVAREKERQLEMIEWMKWRRGLIEERRGWQEEEDEEG